MSDLLNIGASAIRAYSTSLAAVSDNIANSQTPGYARRSVRLEEAPRAGDVALYRNAILPGGVLVDGISRSVNEWLIEDARISGSEAGATQARLDWLQAAERVMDDGPAGIGQSATDMFNVADQLASDPNNEALRSGFLQSVDNVASAFRRTAAGLEDLSQNISAEAELQVGALNNNLAALQRVNDGLQSARDGSTSQAGLLDQRDQLIDTIANTLPVTVEYNERGAVTLKVTGPGGETLLDRTNVATLSSSAAADGTIAFGITPGGSFTPPSGALGGLSQVASHISAQSTELDGLANQFVADLNTAHQAGIDANGNAGLVILTMPAGAASMAAAALTADNIAVSDAGSVNGNILAFANLRGDGGVESNWSNMIAMQALAAASAQAQNSAALTRQEGANAARDEVSGIDLDQEAADLLRFQQAYQGAARVLQVARENMQTILNSL